MNAILRMIILQLSKICYFQQSYNLPSNIHTNIHFKISVIDSISGRHFGCHLEFLTRLNDIMSSLL